MDKRPKYTIVFKDLNGKFIVKECNIVGPEFLANFLNMYRDEGCELIQVLPPLPDYQTTSNSYIDNAQIYTEDATDYILD